jgi:transcriptional regulator with XRE-family HTH domain
MNYSKAIKKIRNILGYSQSQFAKDLDMDQSVLSKIEAGERKPSAELLQVIASKYNIPINIVYLLASDENSVNSLTAAQKNELGEVLIRLLLEMNGDNIS